MKLTDQQIDIINSKGDIVINAVAGSGKTTTLVEYAKARPSDNILYLAFNRSVKNDAQYKFNRNGVNNVDVKTAHGLAHRLIIATYGYVLEPKGYKLHELKELLDVRGRGAAPYAFVSHLNRAFSMFCNSGTNTLEEQVEIYKAELRGQARSFVRDVYTELLEGLQMLWNKMDSRETPVTHDFYLKKFQLENPNLGYDIILFDEGQDASGVMLDVFFKQNGTTKVIVGDAHQQIYAWRWAINSLSSVDFNSLDLTTSFRFNDDIANLASEILALKMKYSDNVDPVIINGAGNSNGLGTYAVLARSNITLLSKIVDYAINSQKIHNFYLEGGVQSYTYTQDGASIYDVLNLMNGKRGWIRDGLIKSMKDMEELKEYIEESGDYELKMVHKMVMQYKNEIPRIMKRIKELTVPDDIKESADMIFSTVHKCKGMEYDEVELCNDFVTEYDIDKAIHVSEEEPKYSLDTGQMSEELNILYVACTRTKNLLYIPFYNLPKKYQNSAKNASSIRVMDMDDGGDMYQLFLIE